MRLLVLALLLALAALGAQAADGGGHVQVTRDRILRQTAIPVYGHRVVQSYPHDRASYTEGLVMKGGSIFEGTGLYGRSKLREWDLYSGRVLREAGLDRHYFGEGVTVLGDTVYQLTYLENTAFTYDRRSFRRIDTVRYPTQGWGLTTDGARLIASDGSSAITFYNPTTLAIEGRVFVTDAVGPVGFLNELEYAGGKLYANVWQTDFIAVIAPQTGRIEAWIDLTGLNPEPQVLVYPLVLNGIAVNEHTGRLLVTGKQWPFVYEIELTARPAP